MIYYTERIFVVGHTGMVGAAIVRQLIRLGHPQNHIITRTHAELDLTNQAAVQAFFQQQKPDQVYLPAAHLGSTETQPAEPAAGIYRHLMVAANVVEAAFQAGAKKLIYVASASTYPASAQQPMAEEDLLSAAPDPIRAPTALAQLAGIQLCESYNRQFGHSHGIDYRCAIACNVYGTGDNYTSSPAPFIPSLMQRMHDAVLNSTPRVIVQADPSTRQEILFVDDMAEACVYLMELPKPALTEQTQPHCSHINIGYGSDMSQERLVQAIAQVVGYRGAIEYDPPEIESPARRLMDIHRLKALGWHALTGLEHGLELSYIDFRRRSTVRSRTIESEPIG
jgi:GDP-L-fucose synthase